jgi:hypothetical protein
VRQGSLLGPFQGQVVDMDTQQPIESALVECTWAFDRGLGSYAPEAFQSLTLSTDSDGRYLVPVLRNFPTGLTTRLARISLLVYKKDYVAYHQDHIFGQKSGRPLFTQKNNVVRLSRWSPELSRSRHLLFLGGGKALQEASQWEALAAAEEVEGKSAKLAISSDLIATPAKPSPDRPLLDASSLISSDEVRSITGYQGEFSSERLAGPRSESYDTFHLRAIGKPERYDVAVRVWRIGANLLESKYKELLESLPGSKQTGEIGQRSFVVLQGEILGLGFLERGSSTVLLLTCGRGQCTQEKQIVEIGKLVEKNLSRLPPLPGEKSEESAPPASQPAPSSPKEQLKSLDEDEED